MKPRVFLNSPMLANGRAAAYLFSVKPLRWAGYIADDGTIRLMVELPNQNDLTNADERG